MLRPVFGGDFPSKIQHPCEQFLWAFTFCENSFDWNTDFSLEKHESGESFSSFHIHVFGTLSVIARYYMLPLHNTNRWCPKRLGNNDNDSDAMYSEFSTDARIPLYSMMKAVCYTSASTKHPVMKNGL